MSIRRAIWKSMAPLAGVLLLAVAAYHFAKIYRPSAIELRCSGRTASAASSRLAKRIVAEVRAADIDLELVAAHNSREICAAVDHGLLDLGVVLGGFPSGQFQNVRQVASLGVEPLHLLVRGELAKSGKPTLQAVKGRSVYLGELGSNGAGLAADVLKFAGLVAKDSRGVGDYDAVTMGEKELLEHVRSIERSTDTEKAAQWAGLPDAVFLVASLPAPVVDGLVKSAGYRLVELPYATALHLDARREHDAGANPLENSRIVSAVIPAFTYGAAPAAPAAPCETVGLRLLLVAHKDVPAESVRRLLAALGGGSLRDYRITLDMTAAAAEFSLHDGTSAYASSQRPVSINDAIQSATNAFSMIGAFCAGAFALWSYFRGLRTVSPQYYLQQIDRIERVVRGVESEDEAPTAPIELLIYLEARLAQLKQTVVEDYARGRLAGDDALIGILTLIADTRNLLVQTSARLSRSNFALRADSYSDAA